MVSLSLKRLFDITVAASVLVLLSPLIALIALAIKLDDGGPVLFVQDRVGRNRRTFRCCKFRTMIVGAESIGNGLIVSENDDRITRVGRWLRKWTLDELPQLLNVLKGDMSIVGPRPWVPSEAAYCGPAESRRFDFRPGMAGWAWIHGRNLVPWNERVRMDVWYVDNWSLAIGRLHSRQGLRAIVPATRGLRGRRAGAKQGALERGARESREQRAKG